MKPGIQIDNTTTAATFIPRKMNNLAVKAPMGRSGANSFGAVNKLTRLNRTATSNPTKELSMCIPGKRRESHKKIMAIIKH